MRPETLQSLQDVLVGCREIQAIARQGWQDDRVASLAIERLLMIVGEALVRIRGSEEKILDSIEDAYKIIAMRNVLVHGYDALDVSRLNDAVDLGLPKLMQEVEALLR